MRRRLTLATISVLALIGGVAFGWIGTAAATGTPTFASHSEAAVFAHLAATLDAVPAALLLLLAAGLLLAVAPAATRRAARLALGERAPPA